jgi:streptogramin lyase
VDRGRAVMRRRRVSLRSAVSVCLLSMMVLCGPGLGAVRSPRPGRLIPVAGAQSVAFGAGQIWVTTLRSIVRLDPARRTVVARTRFSKFVASAAVDGKLVWVMTRPGSSGPGLLYSVDIATGRVVGVPVRLFPMAQGQIIVAGGSLWVTNDNHGRFGRLFRIDPKSRKVVAAVRIPNDPYSVVYAAGSLWVGESDAGKVVRVNPRTGAIEGTPIVVGRALLALAVDRGKIWVANTFSGRLAAIDASTARVISGRPLAGLGGVAASRGTVWTFFFRKSEVTAFDAVSGSQTLAPSKIRGGTDGIAARGRSVWVINPLGITPLAS